ncbi:MAG: chromate resistance protein ChrB domain-containing protein [Pseudomonadota bacterium]
MAQFASISPSALMRCIGTSQAPVIIDVCIDEDFTDDPFLIPTAQRVLHMKIGDLSTELKDENTVIVCQKGRKLSHGAAAHLRSLGIRSEVLEGGNVAWRTAGLPRVPAAVLPPASPGSRWVTRWRPKIDRIACPWLIRRFIDPAASFLFVPPAEVLAVAEKFDAIPFDVPDTRWSHQGQHCTFDTMLAGFGLDTAALAKMAQVIRAADTDDHARVPEAAGLLALSIGLSRGFRDDLAQLDAGMVLYDALYRWARDGQSETHDWQAEVAS